MGRCAFCTKIYDIICIYVQGFYPFTSEYSFCPVSICNMKSSHSFQMCIFSLKHRASTQSENYVSKEVDFYLLANDRMSLVVRAYTILKNLGHSIVDSDVSQTFQSLQGPRFIFCSTQTGTLDTGEGKEETCVPANELENLAKTDKQ